MLGKVDFQKTVYLAEQLGVDLPFAFRWDKLGPYSFELAHFINQLLARGTFYIDRGTYRVNQRDLDFERLKNLTTIDSEKSARLVAFFRSIRNAVRRNHFNIPLFMECLGSLRFIKTSLETSDRDRVFHILQQVKPNRTNEFSPMLEEAWTLLERNDL